MADIRHDPTEGSLAEASAGRARDELTRQLGRALDAADAALALVEAENVGLDLAALEAPPQKIVAETSLLLRLAADIPEARAPGVAARARQLSLRLVPHARHPRVLAAIALHPQATLDYGFAHVMLGAMGCPDPGLDRAMVTALASPTSQARERLPHRELEQQWLASLAGWTALDPGLAARTALGRGVDLIAGTRDDHYALTHALMYATDFGRRSAGAGVSPAAVLGMAEGALAGALDEDDFDLAGEMLLAWPCLDVEWSTTASLAYDVLADVERAAGLLPSLSLRRDEYERQPPEARRHWVAAVGYHTAYVLGVLAACCLRSERYPRAAPSATVDADERARLLLHRLVADAPGPRWLARARSDAATGPWLPLALDVGLRRALRRLDLERTRRLLRAGIGVSPRSPLAGQAAGILRRVGAAEATLSAAGPAAEGRAMTAV
jgi:hypothetical protein